MSQHEDELPPEPERDDRDPLLEEQEGKGYEADEGERGESLDDPEP